MMSKIFTIKAGGKHVEYLSATEYFVTASDEAREASHWQGGGAEALGLAGKSVSVAAFENILAGKDQHGNALTKNANSGTRQKLGFDCVITPPKSVSMALAFAEPWLRDEIIKASEAANAEAMRFISDNLTIRTGQGGERLEKAAGTFIATFTHVSSRALDPCLHHHSALASMAMRQDGTCGSIDGAEVMAMHQTAGAIYQADLAQRLNKLGFTIVADDVNKFAFRVEGFKPEAEREFSQSRNKILSWLKARKLSPSDTAACARAAKAARDGKNEPAFRDLVKLWKHRGEEQGITSTTIEQMRHGVSQDAAATLDPNEILDALTEQQSVFERKDVLKAVAIAAARTGGMTRDDIEKTTDRILTGEAFTLGEHVKKSDRITNEIRQGEAIKLGSYEPQQANKTRPPQRMKTRALYSTPKAIREEIALMEDFRTATTDTRHTRTAAEIDAARAAYEKEMSAKIGKPVTMKPEQQACLAHCATAGRQVLINGLSGTGKSFTMGAVRAMEEAAGQRVIGVALAGQAAASLKDGASIRDGGTLASILQQAQSGKLILDAKTTIILDEAAMVGARQLRELQAAAPEAKIIMLGDRAQYQNIERGAWMGGLQDLGFRTAKLGDIERQKNEWHKEAVLNLKDGRGAEALEAFRENGLITLEPTTESALKKMALDYADDPTAPQEKIAMTSTHADANAVNAEVRRLKIERGELGQEALLTEFTTKDGKATFEREIREGDRLRFTKNAKVLGVFNGEIATVEKIQRLRGGDAELTLAHDNGKTVKLRLSEYSNLEHGYCGTGMGNQGASKHHAYTFLDADTMNKQAAYVLASRSKQETKIYCTTADSEDAADALSKLGRAMSRDGSKDWTLDYLTPEQRAKFTAPEAPTHEAPKATANSLEPMTAKPTAPTAAASTATASTPNKATPTRIEPAAAKPSTPAAVAPAAPTTTAPLTIKAPAAAPRMRM